MIILNFELFINESVNFFEKGKFWSLNGKKVRVVGSIKQNPQVLKFQAVDDSGKPVGSEFVGKKGDVKSWKEPVKSLQNVPTAQTTKPIDSKSLDSNSMKIIEKYYNEILKSNTPLSTISFMGYFTSLSAFRSSLYENLYETYKKVLEGNRKDILEKNLKNILLIELRLDKMAKNAGEGNTGSKDKLSTKRSTLNNSYGEDKYSKSKKIYETEIENNLSNLEKILGKMNSEFNIKPVNSESTKSSDTKDPQVRYKELLSDWKESQKKLGKNTSPGQGTRARLMKQAKSELGIKENIIFRFGSFIL